MKLLKSIFCLFLCFTVSFNTIVKSAWADTIYNGVAPLQDKKGSVVGYFGCFYPKGMAQPFILSSIGERERATVELSDWAGTVGFNSIEEPYKRFSKQNSGGNELVVEEIRPSMSAMYGFGPRMIDPPIVEMFDSIVNLREIDKGRKITTSFIYEYGQPNKVIKVKCVGNNEWKETYPKVVKNVSQRGLFKFLTDQFDEATGAKAILNRIVAAVTAIAAVIALTLFMTYLKKRMKVLKGDIKNR